MRAPTAHSPPSRDHPVPLLHSLSGGAGCEDLEAGFRAGDGGRAGGAEAGGEGGEGGVGASDLVDVGWVEGGGEGAEG